MECIHIPANEQRERTCPTLWGWVITSRLEQEEAVISFPSQFVFKLGRRMRMTCLQLHYFKEEINPAVILEIC